MSESFRDFKSLLGITQLLMNKHQDLLEKMIAFTLLAYTIALLFGETIRDVLYASVDPPKIIWQSLLTLLEPSTCSA